MKSLKLTLRVLSLMLLVIPTMILIGVSRPESTPVSEEYVVGVVQPISKLDVVEAAIQGNLGYIAIGMVFITIAAAVFALKKRRK